MAKKLLIIGAFLVVAVLLIHAYVSNDSGSPGTASTNTATAAKKVIFDESDLTNSGVTFDQMSGLKQVLRQYLGSQQDKMPELVGFSSIQRLPTDPKTTTPFSEITFLIQFDHLDTYKAKMDAFSLSEIRLYLYGLNGTTLLYDSQNVESSQGQL